MTEAFFLRGVGLFLISMVRFSGFFINIPAYGEGIIPMRVKAGISALCALIMLPHLLATQQLPVMGVWDYGFMGIKELAFGMTLGFVVLIMIDSLKFAGEIIGMQIGFSFVQVVNPESTKGQGIVAEFFQTVGTLTFLMIGGHVIILHTFAESFDLVPLAGVGFNRGIVHEVVTLSAIIFKLGLQISTPIIGIILIGDVALGIIARTVPRMNIFQVGFPVKILLGLVTLTLLLPFISDLVKVLTEQTYGHINTLLNYMTR
jgi:flagellar biosynthetic protein FliR